MKVSSNPLVQRIEKHAKGISDSLEQIRNAKFQYVDDSSSLIADEYIKGGKEPWYSDVFGIKFSIDQCKETKATLINFMGQGFRKEAKTNEDIKTHIRYVLWEASRQCNLQIYRQIADSNI